MSKTEFWLKPILTSLETLNREVTLIYLCPFCRPRPGQSCACIVTSVLPGINTMTRSVCPISSGLLLNTSLYSYLFTFASSDIFRYPLHEGLQVLWEVFGVHARVITSITARCLCRRTPTHNACGTDIR